MLKKKNINKTVSNSYTYKSDGMVRNHQWIWATKEVSFDLG